MVTGRLPGTEASNDGAVPRSVLIAGANNLFQQTMVDAFKEAGFRVHACSDTEEARALCRSSQFDLILLDWLVGHHFADEFAALLGAAAHPRPLPPVGVLSCMDEKTTRLCLRPDAPVRGVLGRPVEPGDAVQWALGLIQGARSVNGR